jgi:hypothetical protein
MIVQQGGVTALLRLANEGTDRGRELASQALAKIGTELSFSIFFSFLLLLLSDNFYYFYYFLIAITMDPNIAFKGERAAELVRPLLRLLASEEGLMNFEALMALTNLASMSEEIRFRIVKEKGARAIEYLMFSEHEMIQRAATEAMCNMMVSEEVFNYYAEAETSERMKIFLGLSDVEDFQTRRAASGCLAILSDSEKACRHIQNEKISLEVLVALLGAEPELQHRAIVTLKNISGYPDLAKWLIDSQLMEPVHILTYSQNPAIQQAAKICYENLQARYAQST